MKSVIAIDIGGTKIASAIVDRNGKMKHFFRQPVMIPQGKEAFLTQITFIVNEHLKRNPKLKNVGIACAGPLDSYGGTLLDPTNFRTQGKTWGLFPLVAALKKRMPKMNFVLENDAAAAVLAEKWVGGAKNYANAMIMTLGTGLGAAAIVDGKLVRAGMKLHPDAGLILVNYDDMTAPCGSGNFGSAESYLSGGNFVKRARTALKRTDIDVHAILALAKNGDRTICKMLEEYADVFAVTLYNYATIYSPEVVLLSGSFAKAHRYFLPQTKTKLKMLLKRRRVGKIDLMPKIMLSPVGNESCLLGGAYVAHFGH